MIYNDFPILNNDEYQLIKNHYSNNIKPQRKNQVFKICKELNDILYSCFHLEDMFNVPIKSSIEFTKEIINKHLNNLTELFNVSLEPMQNLKTLNIFTFLKRISNISLLFLEWFETEEKEYYKHLAKNSLNETFNCLEKIFSALELSNIKIFKHM